MKKDFEINGITLSLPESLLSTTMTSSFQTGRYEHVEARQVGRFMRDGDRLLELGAGVGYISALAATSFKLESCTVVEANPNLVPIIQETHALNGVLSTVLNCVAVSPTGRNALQPDSENTVAFYLREDFWGASLQSVPAYKEKIQVPVVDLQELIDEYRPTVVVADIEGGEIDLFERMDLDCIRAVLIETHKNIIGLQGIDRMIRALQQAGLYYNPDFSTGAVVQFERVE